MPKVSVIIPVYNKADYLERCVQAVVQSRNVSFEIVLVDDGSSDGSEILVDRLAEQHDCIHVIHQKNQGASVARNKGLELARGEWIWFVDADDLPESNWLDHISNLINENCYDIIFSDFRRCSSDGKAEIVTTGISKNISAENLPKIFMKLQPSTGYFGYLWCKLLRKHYIEECNASFQPGLKLAEDLKFMVQLYYKQPRCYFTNDIAMNYTVDAINSSKDQLVDYQAQLEIRYEIYRWIQKNDCFEQYRSELQTEVSRFSAFVFFYGFEKHRRILEEKQWFRAHPEFAACLDCSQLSGIMKRIARLLQQEKYGSLTLLLQFRHAARSFIRRVKHQ